jgi:hypothetical protein
MKKVLHLRYLQGTINMRLTLGEWGDDHSIQLSGYADADCDNDATQRKSRSCYVINIVGTGAIGGRSRM